MKFLIVSLLIIANLIISFYCISMSDHVRLSFMGPLKFFIAYGPSIYQSGVCGT
jgi:hypothetical protein